MNESRHFRFYVYFYFANLDIGRVLARLIQLINYPSLISFIYLTAIKYLLCACCADSTVFIVERNTLISGNINTCKWEYK